KEVTFDAALERGISAPTVHLRPAGDARAHLVPQHVVRDLVAEIIHEDRTLRARPDEGHLAAHHVPELGQLVEARLAEESPEGRAAIIVLFGPDRPALGFGVDGHGPE